MGHWGQISFQSGKSQPPFKYYSYEIMTVILKAHISVLNQPKITCRMYFQSKLFASLTMLKFGFASN